MKGLLGAVLAGGSSSRFGEDKTAALAAGMPMIERCVGALEPLCDEVIVVSARPQTPRGRWRIVADRRPETGPLAGIETALLEAKRTGAAAAFVLAADLPLVDTETLRDVAAALEGFDAAAAARDGDPPFEPLCAIYRTGCLPAACAALEDGARSARALFERVAGRTAEIDADVLINVNTPGDLVRAETVAARRIEAPERSRHR